MKNTIILLFALILFQTGCSTMSDPRNSEFNYKVSYTDANGDGKIDNAFFALIGGADGDFKMQDTDFDGRYDKSTIYGIGVFEESVDYPVYLDVGGRKLNRSFLDPYNRE